MAKAKVKFDLRGLTVAELIQKSRRIITQSTGNAVASWSPLTLAQLTTQTDALDSKAQEVVVNHQTGMALNTEQGVIKTSLIEMLTQFGGFVDIKANGDAALIQSTGFDVRASTTTPVGALGQVQNLSVTVGDHDGELDLDWDNVRGATGYLIQQSLDPVTATSWTSLNPVSPSKATIKNLTSGTKYWFRIAANGTDGPGPWSNTVAKIAP